MDKFGGKDANFENRRMRPNLTSSTYDNFSGCLEASNRFAAQTCENTFQELIKA